MKKYLAILLALALLLAGCSAGSKAMESAAGATADAAPMAPMAPVAAPAEDPAPVYGEAAEAEYDFDDDASYSLATTVEAPASGPMENGGSGSPEEARPQPAISAEKLIYRADLYIETLNFDAAVAALDRLAPSVGGFVESSNVSGNTRWQPDGTTRIVDRWANYVIRVPSGRFQETINQAGSLGSVTNSGTSVENITSRFTDQEARKHSLEVQEERLLELLVKAEDVDTLVILESRLSDVRYEIESIERQLRNWQNQVDYSTVSISLQEVAVYTPTAAVQRTFSERLSDSFRDGWINFVDTLEDLSLWFVESLFALLLLAVIVVVVVLVVRKVIRDRRRKKEVPRQDAQPQKIDEPPTNTETEDEDSE